MSKAKQFLANAASIFVPVAFLMAFLYVLSCPVGLSEKKCNSDFWELKVYYGALEEVPASEVTLVRNDDGTYWVTYPVGLKPIGKAVQITDENHQAIIDRQIDG